ncbi:MAG TPA: hypothetical protein DC057_06440 [Spirochaetia bacterium]|nr:hypothetical protein [Spirochaetia bacterium]
MKTKTIIDIEPVIDASIFDRLQRLDKERLSESIRDVSILEAVNVVKSFGSNKVIPDLNFKIHDIQGKSEVICMLGPSGCGKSTILNLIAGLIQPTSGTLLYQGKQIDGPGIERGMIFQKYSSFPFLNVLDNIAYPLIKIKKIKKKEAYEQAYYWIEKLYLKGAEYKYPKQLSGGMQQRVAIARTLCSKAKIILMDEPFGALDRKIRWEMQDLMAELLFFNPGEEVTVFIVTHDIPEAVFLGDRIWTIHKGGIFSSDTIERPIADSRSTHMQHQFNELVSFFNEKIFNLELKAKS